jgi:hypothetical protein
MTISSIILAHYKEREKNLKKIIDDLYKGSLVPEKTIVFIDNPNISFDDSRVIIIRSSSSFLPKVRFALGTVCDTDYCFFIDDDLSVQEKTLENLAFYSNIYPRAVLGFEGSILNKDSPTPYTSDKPVKRFSHSVITEVDIVIRTYFASPLTILAGLKLQLIYPELPRKSLDDVFLCLGNKYLNHNNNYVVPIDEDSDLFELGDGGQGQSYSEEHYGNRNKVCKFMIDMYD